MHVPDRRNQNLLDRVLRWQGRQSGVYFWIKDTSPLYLEVFIYFGFFFCPSGSISWTSESVVRLFMVCEEIESEWSDLFSVDGESNEEVWGETHSSGSVSSKDCYLEILWILPFEVNQIVGETSETLCNLNLSVICYFWLQTNLTVCVYVYVRAFVLLFNNLHWE